MDSLHSFSFHDHHVNALLNTTAYGSLLIQCITGNALTPVGGIKCLKVKFILSVIQFNVQYNTYGRFVA